MATARGNPVEWDHFYKTARWQRLLRLRLRQHPLVRVLPGARYRHGGERGWITSHHIRATGTPSSLVSCRAYASRATSRRRGRSSCAAIL
jgi:hypothetical protein